MKQKILLASKIACRREIRAVARAPDIAQFPSAEGNNDVITSDGSENDTMEFGRPAWGWPAVIVLLALLAVTMAAPAQAATYTVTNRNDAGPGSLRAALGSAGDGDTIRFASGLSGTITLQSPLPQPNAVTFQGGEDCRIVRSDGSADVVAIAMAANKDFTGDMAASLEAESTNGHKATGISTDNGALTMGTLSGSVLAEAANSAYGFYSLNGAITLQQLPGTDLSRPRDGSGHDSLRLGAGVSLEPDGGPVLTLDYQGEVKEYAVGHSLMLQARWTF